MNSKFHLSISRHNLEFLCDFVLSDFNKKYLGSLLGVAWAFAYPMVTLLVLIMVFQLGFKVSSIPMGNENIPFVLWLTCGLAPWFFISDSLISATASIHEYAFIIKKVPFPAHLLPIVKIFSALIIHLSILALTFLFLLIMKVPLSLFTFFQLAYYLLATTMLLAGISLILSSIAVLARDLIYMVAILVQFFFWFTPIFWNLEQLPQQYQLFFKLNPLYYIVSGYRDTLLQGVAFWEKPEFTLYFWIITFVILFFGQWCFKRMRPQFADLL
ncbi:MAG: ABC transporter permease [Oligoflexia bacterium]|nr:ABC transporter permease [Oligoflexia bacterium]